MSNLSDGELISLVLGVDTESYEKLLQYRLEAGQIICVRRMLALFIQRHSRDVCARAWETALTICLTDDEPEMDADSVEMWTDALLAALRDERPEIRSVAAKAFSLGLNEEGFNERIIRSLMEGLRDGFREVRESCGYALEHAGRAVLPHLLRALANETYHKPHEDEEHRASSVWNTLFVIDRILTRPDTTSRDRVECAESVAGFLSSRSVSDGSGDLDVWKAGDTLGEHIGGREALASLSALIDHTDPRVRASVAHGLSHLKEPEARERLHLLLHDGDEGVRNEAAKYLNRPPGSG